jgi:dienelactone hydrolase
MKKLIWILIFFPVSAIAGLFDIDLVYRVYSLDKPAPTIIVGHHCGGSIGHSDDWARQLNKWGFNAVNLDSFTPRKITNECEWGRLPAPYRAEETYDMAEFIKKQPWHQGKIGYIGFSHGGSTAVFIASDRRNKNIDAVVAYYPYCGKWGNTQISSSSPNVKLMLALAKRDDWTPYLPCMGEDKNLEIHLYENATHAFDQQFPGWTSRYLNYYMEHDRQANIDSRIATRIFFKKYLEGMIEGDGVARAEFVKTVTEPPAKPKRTALDDLPDIREPTEEDVKAYEKKQKPKK